MQVSVKLFATLVRHVSQTTLANHPQGVRAGTPLEVELPADSTLADLVAHLGLPDEEIRMIFVNGRARELDYGLAAGDQVGIFPPVGGG